VSRFEHRDQPGPQLKWHWKELGYTGLQRQKLGSGPYAFLKIKQMRFNREQRQIKSHQTFFS